MVVYCMHCVGQQSDITTRRSYFEVYSPLQGLVRQHSKKPLCRRTCSCFVVSLLAADQSSPPSPFPQAQRTQGSDRGSGSHTFSDCVCAAFPVLQYTVIQCAPSRGRDPALYPADVLAKVTFGGGTLLLTLGHEMHAHTV